jgi:hypothetical protein
MKHNDLYILIYILFSPILLMGQIKLEGNINKENVNDNYIVIWWESDNENILVDTIWMFPGMGFSEYFYSTYEKTIYVSRSSYGINKRHEFIKDFYLDTYVLQNGSLLFEESFFIDGMTVKDYLEKGRAMSISFTASGLCFSFQKGKIREITLSYQDLDLRTLPKILRKIEKLGNNHTSHK